MEGSCSSLIACAQRSGRERQAAVADRRRGAPKAATASPLLLTVSRPTPPNQQATMKLLSADQLASQLDDKPTELHRRSWAHLTDRAKRWVAKQLQRTVPSLESQLQLAEQAQVRS